MSTTSSKPGKFHQDPRFSINALMRYMVALPAKRPKIIRDQKYPPTFKVIWYEDACRALAKFLAGGLQDESILTSEISRLESEVPANDQEAQKNDINIEAMEAFLNWYDQVNLGGLTPSIAGSTPGGMLLRDVQLSIRPEIELQGSVKGKPHRGSLKIYLSKSDPLTEQAAGYGAACIMKHNLSHAPEDHIVKPANCSVLDIFGGRQYTAPSAVTRRFEDLEAACEEIALRWPLV